MSYALLFSGQGTQHPDMLPWLADDERVAAMRAQLEPRPGVDYNFSQPIKDRVEESISGIRGQIVVKIYGEDLNIMHEKLTEVDGVLSKIRDISPTNAGDLAKFYTSADFRKYGQAIGTFFSYGATCATS